MAPSKTSSELMASRNGTSRRVTATITHHGTRPAAATSEPGNPRPRAVLVLLRRPAAHAAGADGHAVAHDRHRALARDHVPALRRHDALDDRGSRPLLELAAGPPERHRGDGLALRAVDAAPDGAVHAVERHEPAAGVAHRHADLDVHLARLVERALHDRVGFRERE